MRSIWKGSLTSGLVNVPVSVYSATESHDVRLRQVHDADGGRIRYQRKCEVCEQVVPYENIDRAYTEGETTDRKSTRLNSSHVAISYAVFCLKKKIQHYHNKFRRTQ